MNSMDRRESVAGKYGAKVRSDCRVTFRPGTEGGIALTVESKVATMYGGEIERLAREVLASLGVDHGEVTIEDRGALPFTLAARIETAVRRSLGEVPPWLPPMRKENAFEACTTQRERFRRSRLYLPGNEPKFFINAGLYQADGIILDLEDSVAPAEKDAARILVRNALRAVDFKGSERMVRINPPPLGFEDLEAVVPHNVHVVLIPKCESAEDVTAVARRIEAIREAEGIAAPVYLMPIVESARGVLAALEIAEASPLVVALTIGLEDYTADIGCARTPEGKESLWARSMIVHAAR
ncbi:MAG: citrate lyase ACP, partial [Deltaproteobacteria bacterium]